MTAVHATAQGREVLDQIVSERIAEQAEIERLAQDRVLKP